MEKYKSFVPKFIFHTRTRKWVETNESRENYLSVESLKGLLESITELSPGIIYMTWVDNASPSIYKGIIEYTDEYQLEAELKELSKDFKFKL